MINNQTKATPDIVFTNEFSVCLLCDKRSADLDYKLRQKLPDSPYRDDFPHLTLLRGITAPNEIDDEELVTQIRSFIDSNALLQSGSVVRKIANRPSYIYGLTSLMLLDVPRNLRTMRQTFIKNLRSSGYKVELLERAAYFPHITIRLGVPIKAAKIKQSDLKAIVGQDIHFDEIAIFRLSIRDGKRVMRQVVVTTSSNSPAKV